MSIQRIRSRTAVLVAAFGATAGAAAVVDAARAETLDVVTDGGDVAVDLGEPGLSPGDRSVLDATLTDARGRAVGRLRGVQSEIATVDGRHIAQGQITYSLAGGDIVVGGTSRRPAEGGGLVPDAAFERAVLGGTGAYAGVSGTATTVRDGDRYRTTFALRPGTGASRVTRLRLRSTDIRNTIVDLGDRGRSPGDLSVYNGRLRGDARGWVRGVHTSVRIEGRTETLASAITFELRGRGQIAVGGLTRYPAGDRHKPVRGATVRAVLGGTGDFAGAHGTLRSVRRANGAYELRFSLGAP